MVDLRGFYSKTLFPRRSTADQGSHLGRLLFTLFINDLPSIVNHSRVLMYADDVRLCFSYNNIESGFCLQSDINRFQEWCQYNLLNFYYLKCYVMTFYRGTPTFMSYSLQNMSLERIYSVNDLGVLLDPKLKFDSHITSNENKATSVLWFIKRWSKEFDDPYTTKMFFTSLVRPNLEYCSSVRSPQYQVHIDRIESVQKQFLLFALRGLNWDQNDVTKSSIATSIASLYWSKTVTRLDTLVLEFQIDPLKCPRHFEC